MSDHDTDGLAVIEWLMADDDSDLAGWLAILRRPEWHRRAACRGMGTEAFFPTTGRRGDTARAVCDTCAVRDECMASALDQSDTVGVWAGTTDRDRKWMRRDATDPRPEPGAVTSRNPKLTTPTRAGAPSSR